MRRLLLLVSAVVFVDTIFFAALTLLLPAFSEEFDLSNTEAGILTAAYAAGGIAAALPAGLFASRVGVKPAVVLGLAIMIVTSVVFGFAPSAWASTPPASDRASEARSPGTAAWPGSWQRHRARSAAS